ncbi:hypothetical protein QA600_11355 [Natronococcus sp. A-GB1]|uniref:hypothetical protein n=1 Tax=Natronococcus sp. A-GB1 TaxID=3037648 RepID=UPI00241C6562|nr:hypothetical protein [Natronococcus sp. A-GB1]MDG5759936.1 hypothetical protein [Natronococcus sp. A-GB1]
MAEVEPVGVVFRPRFVSGNGEDAIFAAVSEIFLIEEANEASKKDRLSFDRGLEGCSALP